MKLTILTTQTNHHNYFVQALSELDFKLKVFVEEKKTKFPYSTYHEFEKLRDQFESEKWFSGRNLLLEDLADTLKFNSINCKEAITNIKSYQPDLVIVFGTGVIKKDFIDACPGLILNLHGGDPESYRGLDSHLWAIYHKDYEKIITTIHLLDDKLDNGAIILKGKIEIDNNTSLISLRSKNTELCIKLAQAVIDMFSRNKSIISSPQLKKGRYYSAMPSDLKSICLKNFEKYTKSLRL